MYEYTNDLIRESSPYLLQHAHNPVNWVAWNEAALQKAREENKMLIISIGYSACHWCHVMEHESFEDKIVAGLMNDHFICIKVDREERPDIDDIYMTACQLSNNRGCGWPLNAFALPDGRPVWAGTYFPKENWINILDQFITLQKKDTARLEEAANQLTSKIRKYDTVDTPASQAEFSIKDVHILASDLMADIDFEYGGRKGNPKFPMPVIFEFLLHYHHETGNSRVLDAVTITLDRMARGGIFDQIGGGFARYSVDAIWLAPHFEKMLYDNAQLVSLYANAYKLTGKVLYKKIIVHTIEFIKREMTDPTTGGFFSALDADSEGVEGKYYVWSKEEIEKVIADKNTSDIYCKYYNISDEGNWEHTNILYHDQDAFNKNDTNPDKVKINELIESCNRKLLEERATRIRPSTDNKMLTSWNALMIKGCTDAYTALNDQQYLDMALKTADFIVRNQMDEKYRLNRNFMDGKSVINAFLDDYATVVQAFISIYEVTTDEKWIQYADKMTAYVIRHFYQTDAGMFYYTSEVDPPLVTRKTELSDNVIPASNSIMARNLRKLAALTGNKSYERICHRMMDAMHDRILQSRQPGFYANWCSLLLELSLPVTEIAICGPDAVQQIIELQKQYIPGLIIAGSTVPSSLPLLENRYADGKTYIYVCKDHSCKMPTESVDEALALM
jgi:uncharacterized protein